MSEQAEQSKRLCVGLMVSHLDNSYDSAITAGAIEGAEQMDADLVILPGRYINGVYADQVRTTYEYQYNTLFKIPTYCRLDALLVLIGTLGNHLDAQERKELLAQYGDIPIITISSHLDGYPCIQADNRTGLDELVQHLITVHRCTRIGFVSGPKTNDEANLRLSVYRSVLERNSIAYDPARVIFGNFSRYCAPLIAGLLDTQPDLQALVCANDQMALAAYEVLEQRGLRPGRDILVTGFDDDPIALEVNPKLTTVTTDILSLGREAVAEAVHYAKTGEMRRSLVPTKLTLRNSCGCRGNPRLQLLPNPGQDNDLQATAQSICRFLLPGGNAAAVQALLAQLDALIPALHNFIAQCNVSAAASQEQVLGIIGSILQEPDFSKIHSDDLYTILEYGYKSMISRCQLFSGKQAISELFFQIYRTVAEESSRQSRMQMDAEYFMNWQTNSITRDMLSFDAYDDRSYQTVVDKLQQLRIRSSYLFTYGKTVAHRRGDTWVLPETLYLKSYHNSSPAVLLPPERQQLAREQLLSHPYLPRDRRCTMLVMPLFSQEDHYGLLLCEADKQYFHYAQSVSFQLCAALKTIDLMRQQQITQHQLRQSLIQVHESNQLLSELSKTDPLTGCLNRRGLYDELRKKLQSLPINTAACMVYGDLDSLKIINDLFGHKEGDFAIRAAADILRQTMEPGDILARIGGDEFVGCVFTAEDVSPAQVLQRIEDITGTFNDTHTSTKGYKVHLSIGVFPFRCSDTVDIGKLLSHADALLYTQKKNKHSILRTAQTEA